MNVLLVSTYELGRQPFGLASPAAWLRRAGHSVVCADLSRQPLDEAAVRSATLVAFYLPMHTATRLALPVIDQVRTLNPAARLGAYGLYAPLNETLLRTHGISSILGGEFEQGLVRAAAGLPDEPWAHGSIPRLTFVTPDRRDLPPLSQYAALTLPDGTRRVAGYTEASRGCKHSCRHCPVVPVYDGQFRIVSPDVVLADIREQVERGAQHVTFGDPDFFNGIGHALRVIDRVSQKFPKLTYDVTIKIEHLLRHAQHLPRLRDTGCLFVTSAVEALDNRVLEILDKGHTREDFVRCVGLCRDVGLALSPTFVAFTPWTTLEGYRELLKVVDELDLVDHVAPIQLTIRLLLPEGSRLLELGQVRDFIGSFDSEKLVYRWVHSDPRVDELQRHLAALVGARPTESRRRMFEVMWGLANANLAGPPGPLSTRTADAQGVACLDEPWYCCAEPV
ncbi:MAG: radical SAM protein [Acidobacteria bacterium]|nr:MAG: radical SAM protein [Acidobacteriota bacterium]